MSRRMNLGSRMILVCLFSGVGVEARQEALPKDKSSGQSQRSVASDPEMPRGGPDGGPAQNVAVPRLVKFSSIAKDQLGHAPTGVVGVTFAIYKEQEGGAALWIERLRMCNSTNRDTTPCCWEPPRTKGFPWNCLRPPSLAGWEC